jgi:hypothetical protein
MLERFVSMQHPAPVLIEGVRVEQDPEAAAVLARKIAEAKHFLGEKYLCHPSQQVQRKAA